jgi:hypothetical protein
LEIDDIRQALPIDTMTIEEIADVVARLEEADISVDIDAGLLTPHHRKMALQEVKPTPEPSQHRERVTAHPRTLSLASSIKAAKENSSRPRGPTRPYVQKSATIFILAAALILFVIALGVWRFV